MRGSATEYLGIKLTVLCIYLHLYLLSLGEYFMIYEWHFSIAHFSMLSSVLFPGLLTYFNLFSALSIWTLANINYSTASKAL